MGSRGYPLLMLEARITNRKSSNLLSNVWVFSFGSQNYGESSLFPAWKISNFNIKPFPLFVLMSYTGFLVGKLVYLATKLRDRVC